MRHHAPGDPGRACAGALRVAWTLKSAWPESKFEIVWDAGHASTEPGIIDALLRATDEAVKV